MKTLRLPRLTPAFGEIVLPGSKSLSNRILLLSALARGKTKITNLLDSDDVRHMLDALKLLGVEYTLSDDRTECHLTGQDGPFNAQDITLYLGNAGTAMRPLTAALCFADGGNFELTGLPRMYERPIGDLVTPLRELGAEIEYLQETGYPPLKIAGKQLTGGEVSVSGAVSSQFLSALLMAGPLFSEGLTVNIEGTLVSKPYIDITINCLKLFGIETQRTGYEQFVIAGGQQYRSPEQVMIEGDASSASYFLAAAAISGGKVRVLGTGTNSVQGDKEFAQVLKLMGAEVNAGPDWIEVTGTGPLQGIDVDLNAIPDAAMTIAVAALFASGTTTIRNIYNWRVKETDRLTAMATELRKVGAEVIEGEDFITITPPAEINPATIDTYDDHRMAMCFSLVAYAVDGVVINDPDCTHKTYPGYFDDLASLSQ